LIKNLYLFNKYSARKLIKEFPEKGWKLRTLNYFLKRLRECGSTGRKPGSGMQQTITDDAIDEWHARLRARVRARGGHFEHLLQIMICSRWFFFFHFGVSYACKKAGNNDDFIAYLNKTFKVHCLQVFIFYIR